ncbi:PREDICTED: uncharacterized protein LOC109115039 [Nelumbo nucifera]|uniref:Uncharacterized protein LOC109115039 n=1 Tax=Nelumbo nucifera TaxID=4432 RepID=A0A1U8Q6G8_NELNU|nr:PREDICTED: uncharacterized protein LOC109115039 [Nelumbo nucifera]
MLPPEGYQKTQKGEACTSESEIISVKQFLDSAFTIKDLGYAKYFTGLEIARSSTGTYINQRKYALDILKDAGLLGVKPAQTPLPKGLKFSDNSHALPDPDRYRRLIGRLLYLSLTRPDLSYATQHLSQFVSSPTQDHWNAAVHLLKYLKGCPSKDLFFSSSNTFDLQAYCDADWASCPQTRKSLTGYCMYLSSSLISWKTKKQTTVSRSSAEAEYRSLATTICEVQWISYILADFRIPLQLPIPLWCDNQAALHITANPVFHECTKHLEIDCHLVMDKFKQGFVKP